MVLGPTGEINVIGDWFKLHYILNEGMAFGIQFGYEYGKLGLTLFRLVAMVFIYIMVWSGHSMKYLPLLLSKVFVTLFRRIYNFNASGCQILVQSFNENAKR